MSKALDACRLLVEAVTSRGANEYFAWRSTSEPDQDKIVNLAKAAVEEDDKDWADEDEELYIFEVQRTPFVHNQPRAVKIYSPNKVHAYAKCYDQLVREGGGLVDISLGDLTNTDFEGANIMLADLTGADLHGVTADNADFSGSVLRDANLADIQAVSATFSGADLTNAIMVAKYLPSTCRA